jgi:hypothetical protein
MDDILEEELTWNTGMKYKRPKEYMPTVGFQQISDENNPYNKKSGDLYGYCVAWCFWYLETKLANKNIDSKTLVDKLLIKINSSGIKFSEYIRNYAKKIMDKRQEFLLSIGFDPKNVTNENYTNNDYDKIYNALIQASHKIQPSVGSNQNIKDSL